MSWVVGLFGEMQKQPKKKQDDPNTTPFGDLVNGIAYSLFLPVYVFLAITEPEEAEGAMYVSLLFAWVAACCWLSYYTKELSWLFSLLAFCGQCICCACMNLYEWPHKGEIVVLPQFLWSLLIASANQNLNFPLKIAMSMISLFTAVFVTIQSPLGDLAETSPSLLGGMVAYTMFHYYARVSSEECKKDSFLSARTALLVLAGVFAHHVASELIVMLSTPGYAMTGGFSILKAGFFGAVGFASASAFHREIDLNETLSVLVEERAKELSRQSSRLQMIGRAMEKSETALAITDSRHHVIWANGALGRLAGVSETQTEGEDLIQLLPMTHWDRSKLKNCFSRTNEDDVHVHDRVFRAQVSPFPDEEQSTGPRFVVALKDITEKRAREKAEKIAEEESLLARALTEAMEMLSHELRTPLQGIMGMTSLLIADSGISPDSKEPLSLIMASSRLLLTLINNMLDIRKCDANMMDNFAMGDHEIGQSLKEAVDFCRPIGSIAGVELITSTDATEDVTVSTNPVRLQQMIINLVSNAIKYSPKQSVVTIGTSLMTLEEVNREMDAAIATGPRQICSRGTDKATSMILDASTSPRQPVPHGTDKSQAQVVCVSVTDTGPGIDEEGRKVIFQRFSQLKSKQENSLGNIQVGQPSGTGLGLNLCIKFATRMRGTMWVKNNTDKGSSFCFYIPVVSTSADSALHPRQPSVTSEVSSSLSLSERSTRQFCSSVLVVDDTAINLKVLRRILLRIGVNSVTTVESGEAALEALDASEKESMSYDLIITDIQMPGMDGFEFCRTVRNRPTLQPPVVGLTAETSEVMHEKAERSGMRTILFKPITAIEMKQFLSETLQLSLEKG